MEISASNVRITRAEREMVPSTSAHDVQGLLRGKVEGAHLAAKARFDVQRHKDRHHGRIPAWSVY